MKKSVLFMLIVGLVVSINIDSTALTVGGKELVKLGQGSRTKFPLGTVYYASLWAPAEMKGKSAKEIIEADVPAAVILQIDSKFLTREKFLSAVQEGFGKAAGSGYATDKKQSFLDLFKAIEFQRGDIISLFYAPKGGLTAYFRAKGSDKAQNVGTTPGLAFKQALFAIWLGSNPAQESLKRGMLGQ